MLDIEISAEAENDLLTIWLYIAEDQPVNADRFLDKLMNSIEKLGQFPQLGVQRTELLDSLRSFSVGRYILYYLVSDKALNVVRVLAADMDVRPEFSQ